MVRNSRSQAQQLVFEYILCETFTGLYFTAIVIICKYLYTEGVQMYLKHLTSLLLLTMINISYAVNDISHEFPVAIDKKTSFLTNAQNDDELVILFPDSCKIKPTNPTEQKIFIKNLKHFYEQLSASDKLDIALLSFVQHKNYQNIAESSLQKDAPLKLNQPLKLLIKDATGSICERVYLDKAFLKTYYTCTISNPECKKQQTLLAQQLLHPLYQYQCGLKTSYYIALNLDLLEQH